MSPYELRYKFVEAYAEYLWGVVTNADACDVLGNVNGFLKLLIKVRWDKRNSKQFYWEAICNVIPFSVKDIDQERQIILWEEEFKRVLSRHPSTRIYNDVTDYKFEKSLLGWIYLKEKSAIFWREMMREKK